jgi:hypothetical protein
LGHREGDPGRALLRYTAEDVLPRIGVAIAAVRAERSAQANPPARNAAPVRRKLATIAPDSPVA